MKAVPQPEVFLTPESHKIESRKKRKPIFRAILGVSILMILIFGIMQYRNQIQDNFSLIQNKLKIDTLLSSLNVNPQIIKPQIISQGKITDLAPNNSSVLFNVDLEYDPKTNAITLLKTSLIKGEQASLFADLPKDLTPGNFAYKIEVSSSDGKTILESGWKVTFKKAVETPKGTYRFGVATNYKPNAIIKVYLPENKLIWTGKVQEKSV